MIGAGERTPAELAAMNSPAARKVAGMIRKLVVLFTGKGTWELQGFRALQERVRAEVFQGLGLWARPPANAQVTAVVVSVGDSDNPVVIALRDERTRQAVANALADDETLLHNSLAGVHLQADGTVHVRAHGGVAERLPTWSDFQALLDWIADHGHTGVTTGAGISGPPNVSPIAVPPGAPVPTPTGTTVLRGQ